MYDKNFIKKTDKCQDSKTFTKVYGPIIKTKLQFDLLRVPSLKSNVFEEWVKMIDQESAFQ